MRFRSCGDERVFGLAPKSGNEPSHCEEERERGAKA
jgi:hypothetical protein